MQAAEFCWPMCLCLKLSEQRSSGYFDAEWLCILMHGVHGGRGRVPSATRDR
jgi:hypothetical protein